MTQDHRSRERGIFYICCMNTAKQPENRAFPKPVRPREARKVAIKPYSMSKDDCKHTFFEELIGYNAMMVEGKLKEGLGNYCISMLFAYIKHGKPATIRKIDRMIVGRVRNNYNCVYGSLEILINKGYLAKHSSTKRVAFGHPVIRYRVTLQGYEVATRLRKIAEPKVK